MKNNVIDLQDKRATLGLPVYWPDMSSMMDHVDLFHSPWEIETYANVECD